MKGEVLLLGIGLALCQGRCAALTQEVDPGNSSGAPPTNEISADGSGEHLDRAMVLVVGAPGTASYAEQFGVWAQRIKKACSSAGIQLTTLEPEQTPAGPHDNQKQRFAQALARERNAAQLWIVLIGHGTYDGKTARFNLHGPDVSAAELNEWLGDIASPVAIVNCSSASAPFLQELSAPGRVVATATRSGFEHNFARFGDFFSQSLEALEADFDKDKQVSLLESYLFASRRVAESYSVQGQLATEHALLDDNGDKHGTPADWFRGVRVVSRPSDAASEPDGMRASQWHLLPSEAERRLSPEVRARRDALELQLDALRRKKGNLPDDAYYEQLEKIALELARLYAE